MKQLANQTVGRQVLKLANTLRFERLWTQFHGRYDELLTIYHFHLTRFPAVTCCWKLLFFARIDNVNRLANESLKMAYNRASVE